MRTCARCQVARPVADFHAHRGTLHGYCRACRREYNREWYARNRRQHIANVRRNSARYIARNTALVAKIKDRPCADCGERFPPEVMEFDHVTDDKAYDVSYLMRSGAAEETILAEIAKCELVCANCHRIRTITRLGRSTPMDPPG